MGRIKLQIALLVLFVTNIVLAGEADSLKIKLKKNLPDSIRTQVLVDLAWQLKVEGKTDEALSYCLQARKLAEKDKNIKENANSYIITGTIYEGKEDFQNAIKDFSRSLELFKSAKFKPGVIRSTDHINSCYARFGKHDQAIAFCLSQVEEAKRDHDSDLIAKHYNSIGSLYHNVGKSPEALKAYLTSLSVSEKSRDQYSALYCCNNIAILFKGQQRFQESIKYYLQALNIATELKDSLYIASSLYNLACFYYEIKDYEKAMEYNSRSIIVYKLINDIEFMGECYITSGSIYETKGDQKKALDYYKRAYSIFDSTSYQTGLYSAGLNIGVLLSKQKDLTGGKKYLNRSLSIAQKLNIQEELMRCYLAFYEYYQLAGDFKESLEYFKKSTAIKDTLLNKSNNDKILKQQMGFEFEKKEEILKAENQNNLALSAAEKKKQNIVIFAISVGLILVLTLAVVILRSLLQNKQKNKIITQQKELVEEKNKEVMESIKYARRIQQSLMPTEKYIERNLKKK